MKKQIFIFLLMIFVAVAAKAQTSVAFRAGINYSQYDVSDKVLNQDIIYDISDKISLAAAVDVDVRIGYYLWIRTGLGYSQQNTGVDFKDQFTTVMPYADYTLNFVNVPILLKGGVEITKGSLLFAAVGPDFGLGVGGKMVIDYQIPNREPVEHKIVWDGEDGDNPIIKDHLKRLNIGLNATLGYQMAAGLVIQAHYAWALTNMAPNSDNTFKSSYFGATIGFRLYND